MKVVLKIEIDFESWFEENRQPKTKEDWAVFFANNLMSESPILGLDDGENQDMISMTGFNLECTDVS